MKLTFSQLRQVITAERNFSPEQIQEDEDLPVPVLIIGFLAIIGAVTVVYFIGVAVINLV